MDDEVVRLITDRIEVAVKDRFRLLNRKVDSIQKVVDVAVSDMDTDRKELSQMRIDITTNTQQIKEILQGVQGIPGKISDKVEEQTEKMLEKTAQKVADKVEPVMSKTVEKINKNIPLKRAESWIKKLFRWG